MELSVAINLIEKGILKNSQPQTWADLGAGEGLFSTALSTLLNDGSTVYAIDKDKNALSKIKLRSANSITLKTVHDDFTNLKSQLEPLDGILMANSLHFVSDKFTLIKNLQIKLKPLGRFIIIEYDMNKPNAWVPYPIRFEELKILAQQCDLVIEKIGEHPSRYNSSNIYAAFAHPDPRPPKGGEAHMS